MSRERQSRKCLHNVQERIRWLITNGPTLLVMLEHVSWAMQAVKSLPPLPPVAAMQQLYAGISPRQESSSRTNSRSRKTSSSSSSDSSSDSSLSSSGGSRRSTKSIKDIKRLPKLKSSTNGDASRKRKSEEEAEDKSTKIMRDDHTQKSKASKETSEPSASLKLDDSSKLNSPHQSRAQTDKARSLSTCSLEVHSSKSPTSSKLEECWTSTHRSRGSTNKIKPLSLNIELSKSSKLDDKQEVKIPLQENRPETSQEWLRKISRELRDGKENKTSSSTSSSRPKIIEDITILN